MAANDLVVVRVLTNGASTRAINDLGFKYLSGTANAQGLVTDLQTSGQLTQFMKGKGTDVSITQVQVVDVVPGTGATYSTTPTPTIAGDDAAASDYLPQQCALVTTLYTALKGRSYRGRVYHVGYREARQASGVWDATAKNPLDTWCTNMLARYGSAGTSTDYQWVVISRYLDHVKRATPVGTVINSFATRTTVYTQRRRVTGVGL